jgi:hypothetical protein
MCVSCVSRNPGSPSQVNTMRAGTTAPILGNKYWPKEHQSRSDRATASSAGGTVDCLRAHNRSLALPHIFRSFVAFFPRLPRRFTALSNFALHQSMDTIWEPFWELNLRGFMAKLTRTASARNQRLIVPYLVAMATDLDEAWQVSCRPKNGLHCHLQLKISKADYCDPNVRACVKYVLIHC